MVRVKRILKCVTYVFSLYITFYTLSRLTFGDSYSSVEHAKGNPYVCNAVPREISVRRKFQKNLLQVPELLASSKNLASAGSVPLNPALLLNFTRPKIRYLKEPLFEKCVYSPKVNWKMVTFVKSAAKNAARREWIRRSWGSLRYIQGGSFDTIFVLGETNEFTQALVDEEYRRNEDILQIAVPDDYKHILMKTLAGMQWATEYLPEEYFYATADDDFLVDMGLVQDMIDQYQAKVAKEEWPEFPIICMFEVRDHTSPIRDLNSKYYVSKEEYKWPYWPRFCLGGMYATSLSVTRQLWELSQRSRSLDMDDVWITGILREALGMPHEMVISLEVSAAQHFYNFVNVNTDSVRGFMKTHWDPVFKRLKHKTVCTC